MTKTDIGDDWHRASQLLQQGQIVAIPTETVYGLAGNALDTDVVAQIFTIKNRPSFDPLIIHTDDFARARAWITDVPDNAQALADAFMPGPLTLLLTKLDAIPEMVTAGSPLVAVRIPKHPLAQQLLADVPFPVAAPSANPFGYISPTCAEHVAKQLDGKISYILDGGQCPVGVESTIVGFDDGHPVIYRKGGVTIEEIEQAVGAVDVRAHSSSSPQAPGMLKSHYAPSAPVKLGNIDDLLARHGAERVGIISLDRHFGHLSGDHQVCLSLAGNLEEAARNLFAGLRKLDEQSLDIILAELVPEQGLGRAINDRLRRAAATESDKG